MTAYALDQFRGAYAVLRFRPEGFLYYPVLQAVVADDYQPAAGLQRVDCLLKPAPYIVQFSVDGNAKGLEGARCRVNAAAGRSHPAGDDPGQFRRTPKRPVFDQRPGYGAGPPFLSVASEYADEFPFAASVDKLRRRRRGCSRVEPHVQRLFAAEAESTA